MSVSLPAEFQRAVNEGAAHIIIQEHLDLTGLAPAVGRSEALELLIHQASTLSIRVCILLWRACARVSCLSSCQFCSVCFCQAVSS